MDPQNNEALKRILDKLDAIEDHLHDLDSRLHALEGERPTPHTTSSEITPPPPLPTQATPPQPDSPDLAAASTAPGPTSTPSASIDQILTEPTAPEPPPKLPPTPAATPVSTTSADSTSVNSISLEPTPADTTSTPATSAPTPGPHPEPALSTLNSQLSTPQTPSPDREAKYRQAVAGLRPGTVPGKPKESWEVRIATTWMLRIGLFFLALVCLLFAREYTQGPLGKVIATYVAAFALIGVGLWKEKQYPQWARPVMAGGLAFSYFASYAIGFVEPMRLLDSLSAKLILLGINLVVIFGVAHWKKSEVIGGTALILGYLTTGVVGNDVAAFSSSLALSVAALLFLWLNKWYAATALACAATYLAHFYVWRFVPEADTRTPLESFWHHFLFLSLYFTVFTAAALAGKSAAREEAERANKKPTMLSLPIQSLNRHNILTALSQTNVVAYVVGMITLLKLTNVYWNQAWLFLLPMAAAFGALGLLFTGFATIQMTHLVAATLCLTLGLIAAASPMWLPIFLTLQALLMLAGSRGRYGQLWQGLSLIVLGYACAYVVTGGAVDVLQLSTPQPVKFPWWTFASVTAIALAYTIIWERRLAGITTGLAPAGHFFVALISILVWTFAMQGLPNDIGFLYHAAAIPIVAAVAVIARARALVIFITGTILVSLIDVPGYGALSRGLTANLYWASAIAIAGIAAALLAEKRSTGAPAYDRWLWRIVYAWSQFLLSLSLWWLYPGEAKCWAFATQFAASIALAWIVRSAALGKSAFVAAVFILAASTYSSEGFLVLALLVAAASYPIGLPAWARRTGDTQPHVNRWGQALMVGIAGALVQSAANQLDWNEVLTFGAFALFAAAYAASGRFKPVVVVVLLCAVGMFMLLSADLSYGMQRGPIDEKATAISAAYSLLGVFLLVGAERVLTLLPRRKRRGLATSNPWFLPNNQALLTSSLALATLIMAVMALRTMPDLRLFYFTGAMVAAAFVWIVFGFWFNESAYRKSGFVLLCIGIVKGLIWDVLSLKQTFYRLVSWSILGLLAIAASFLYTRFKSRIHPDEEQPEPPYAS